MKTKIEALAKFLECDSDEAKSRIVRQACLTIIESGDYLVLTDLECDSDEAKSRIVRQACLAIIESGDYLVLTDKEADEKTAEYIKDSLWAFNADFILSECGLDLSGSESLKTMQEKSCESANDFVLSLVEKTCGLASFVKAAISADGRGHFLASYDGEENKQGNYFIYCCN